MDVNPSDGSFAESSVAAFTRSRAAFDLKGVMSSLTVLRLRSRDLNLIERQLRAKVMQFPQFFQNSPIVLDVSEIEGGVAGFPLAALVRALHVCKVVPVAVTNIDDANRPMAAAAGLGIVSLSGAKPGPEPETAAADAQPRSARTEATPTPEAPTPTSRPITAHAEHDGAGRAHESHATAPSPSQGHGHGQHHAGQYNAAHATAGHPNGQNNGHHGYQGQQTTYVGHHPNASAHAGSTNGGAPNNNAGGNGNPNGNPNGNNDNRGVHHATPTPPRGIPLPGAHRAPLVIRQPVRSGQLIYAENNDLIVLAPVNPGAQIVADGNIHVYANMRGRAVAGAKGFTEARIFCQRFEAELIAIAGAYLTFEDIPRDRMGKPAQVYLQNGVCTIGAL
jgi:septum formation inhibitor MinC